MVTLATVRDPDGLAMSSRNTYLNPEERQAALVLSQALRVAQDLYSKGETNADRIRQEITGLIQQQPLADIDYISIADISTLDELDTVSPPALVSLAVRIGKTRLIDNVVLKVTSGAVPGVLQNTLVTSACAPKAPEAVASRLTGVIN